ncbi:hypothetical protein [Lysobacter gummosus]|uniref:hypothetical protein n=1 Tax=Lysobacter gummosus TaxID=262324 RepID=UPI0036364334
MSMAGPDKTAPPAPIRGRDAIPATPSRSRATRTTRVSRIRASRPIRTTAVWSASPGRIRTRPGIESAPASAGTRGPRKRASFRLVCMLCGLGAIDRVVPQAADRTESAKFQRKR